MMIPAFFFQNLPKPPFTVDQMILLKTDNILKNDLPGLKDLSIKISDMKTELLKIYKWNNILNVSVYQDQNPKHNSICNENLKWSFINPVHKQPNCN